MSYFIRARGKVVGPFDQGKLQALLKQGKIGRTHEISEDKIEWNRASECDFLFPAGLSEDNRSTKMPTSNISEAVKAPSNVEWYFSLDGETPAGPVTHEEMVLQIQQGRVHEGTLAWRGGDPSSASLGTFPEFAAFLNSQASSTNSKVVTSTTGAGSRGSDSKLPRDLVMTATKARGWLVFLYVCFAIYIAGCFFSAFRLGPIGIIPCIVLIPSILSCVSLIQYASSLGAILLKQDEASLQKSLAHLNRFFILFSVWIILVFLVVFLAVVLVASGEYAMPDYY